MICESCGSSNLFKFNLDFQCGDCGMFIINTESVSTPKNIHDIERSFIPNIKDRTQLLTGNKKIMTADTWGSVPPNERNISIYYNHIYEICSEKRVKSILYTTINKETIASAFVIYYKYIDNSDKHYRAKTKTALIAYCIMKILYNNGILVFKKGIAKVFGITGKNISVARNIINHICLTNVEFRKQIDSRPLNVLDIANRLISIYPDLDKKTNFMSAIYRISNKTRVSINTPNSIVAGIALEFSKHDNINIQSSDLCNILDISDSSLRDYNAQYSYLVYKRGFSFKCN
jgi:hypothetical protein